ncbi:MAG: diaminopimelate decarboxylase [Sphingobacteriales bacterium]|nr:diaminopimelate decarboxylase [Sphingobacteriales bacterium]
MNKQVYESPSIQKMNGGLMNKFGTRSSYEPVKQIDGVAVNFLMEQFGSPLFVLSERTIRRSYQSAVRAFKTRYPKVQFAWSYKTNYLNAVCRIFHQEGSWAEVVSGFEYRKAVGNGVPGHKIIFNGPGKTDEELRVAANNGSLIHIDHFDELYQLIALSDTLDKKPKVAIRVNMDTGVYPLWDRFGFNYENGQAAEALGKITASGKLELAGLHCHIGTYMLSPDAYVKAVEKLGDLAWKCKTELNSPVRYIDLGGGFPSTNTLRGSFLPGPDTVPPVDEFAEAITSRLLKLGFGAEELPLLLLESGRVLVDDAGFLLSTVLAGKRLPDGRRAIILDAGVNLLFTSFWYDHPVSPAQDFTHHTEDMALFGPLCMNIDVLRQGINLPLLNRGDRVVVHKVGAYNMTQWMQFIQMRPNVVLIDEEGGTHLIRQAEDLAYLEQLEKTPEHLKEINL